MNLRIGISMRVANATAYNEPRDAIARDWSNYMLSVFPNSKWLFIPNIGSKYVNDYIKKWEINVLFLSGGDDIGLFPERDETEIALVDFALKNKIPIVAICRGMQLIHSIYGGKFAEKSKKFVANHNATMHLIDLEGKQREVNSFHTHQIDENTIHNGFQIIGRCLLDNSVESFINKNILAMMWHPERDQIQQQWNQDLILKFIHNEY